MSNIKICGYQVCFSSSKYSKTRFRPGLRPDPARRAYDAPPDPLVGWGGDTHSPYPSRLGRLDLGAFGASVARLLSQERVNQRTSNLADTFTVSIQTKVHLKFRKSSRGRTQGLSKIFRAPIYRAHRAVIFVIAQLSCLLLLLLFLVG